MHDINETNRQDGLAAGLEKMESAGMTSLAQEIFRRHYHQLQTGRTGTVRESEIERIDAVRHYHDLDLDHTRLGHAALHHTAVLKLNGGLGTTMGLNGPKSLLKVKDNLSFLQIFTRQIAYLRHEYRVTLPLILLNSFNTHEETLTALNKEATNNPGLTMSLVQHQIPKLWQRTLAPAKWPMDPAKEWCPPGHGDLFATLVTSQTLSKLLTSGYEYLFISNADNLGAVVDPQMLGYMVAERSPFVMEVAQRTFADRKGGHLARSASGQLCIREAAQCDPDEQQHFMDIVHHRFFNTNNIWIHLPTLQDLLHRHSNLLPLPLIQNIKRVDASRSDSPHVTQLETAVGSAIGLFDGAKALSVPRSRFVPVKSNEDLARLRSNTYQLADGYRLTTTSPRTVAESTGLTFSFGDDSKELSSATA